jgi:hypothetical protein
VLTTRGAHCCTELDTTTLAADPLVGSGPTLLARRDLISDVLALGSALVLPGVVVTGAVLLEGGVPGLEEPAPSRA